MSATPASNQAIARVLGEVADLLEIQGANPFRIRSYRIAAESVAAHGEDVAGLAHSGALREALEVGEGLAAKIAEIASSGDCSDRRQLLEQVPGGLLELLRIPGLGPRTVGRLWKELGITSASELERAIGEGRFRTLRGMGARKEESVRRGLARLRESPPGD